MKLIIQKIANTKKYLFCLIFLVACTNLPVTSSTGEYRLNSPSSMVIVPGTNLAIVANGNINLDQNAGAFIAVNLDTNELLTDTLFEIPNFTGDMFLDTTRNRIYIPDHDEALLIYEYEIPGADGNEISFSALNVSPAVDDQRPNGIETDEGPTQALMIPGTSLGDLILVTNQKGSVSMVRASTLKTKDMDDEEDYFGLRLFSASNFTNLANFPGRGSSRMSIDPTTGLVYITSTLNNQIYVLDPNNQTIEAMIDLDNISSPLIGAREMVIDSNGIAYIAHSGMDSIVVIDVSSVTKNGIPLEVIVPPLLEVIPVGDGPEDVELNAAESTLFVSNQNEDSIYLIDTTLRQITKKTFLNKAKNPGRLVLDETRNTLYTLDFFSNTISLIDATTGNLMETIE
jgi:DNA-binding beta-propeller fold protein YncE